MFKKALPWSRKMPAPDEKVFIKGEKVILREKRIEDAADDYAWRSDEELARLDATRTLHMSFEDFTRYSKEELAFPSPRSKRISIDTLDGSHIGNCMYYDIDPRRGEAEMGVMIGNRDYWSRGYGTDSVAVLLSHIFTTTPLTRVYLHTLEWNHRARRAFTKAGFREVKSVRRNGMDFILMEVWRDDWERPKLSVEQGVGEDGRPSGQNSQARADGAVASDAE